jgi:hypothetical protein
MVLRSAVDKFIENDLQAALYIDDEESYYNFTCDLVDKLLKLYEELKNIEKSFNASSTQSTLAFSQNSSSEGN